MKLSFSATASRHIENIHAHISRDTAMKVVARIEEIAKFIGRNPDVGCRTITRAMRAFPVAPYPYVIYFRKLRDEVRIVRVLHSARKRPELREDGPSYETELAQVR